MFGIARVGTYLPPARQDNLVLGRKFGFDEAFLRDKLGVLEAARREPGQETSDLCIKAFEALQARGEIDPGTLDLIVVVTQNPDGHGLPHTSAIVHGKLGLPKRCFAFDVSLGCSGYVAALAVVRGFLAATGGRRAVLFTADPYSKILDPEDRNTLLIFGDGATASVIEESDHWRIGEFDLGTDGARSGALATMPNGLLRMNGRSVFDFCALNVPGSVERALAANGLDKSRVDRFLLHPGSRYVVDTLTSRLGLGEVPFPAAAYGNTVSSSIPMMLAELDPKKDRTVLLSGFGVGMSWATTVLKGKSP